MALDPLKFFLCAKPKGLKIVAQWAESQDGVREEGARGSVPFLNS